MRLPDSPLLKSPVSDPLVRESFFTTANILSLSRPPLGLLFAVGMAAPWGGSWFALAVLAVAGVTDALDGRFARAAARRRGARRGETPAGTGSWLDPICDKLFVATVLGAIWFRSRPGITLFALILTRELAQVPLSLVYVAIPALRRWLRYDFRASVLGKAATVLQFAAIAALLFGSALAPAAAVASSAVGLLALGDYIARAVRLSRRRDARESTAASR